MKVSDIITLDLLTYYDGKLKTWIGDNYSTKEETNAAILDILNKMWSNNTGVGGYFETTYTHDDGSYAKIWNESDGGGVQYFNSSSNIRSFTGVNDGTGNDIYAQIYAIDKDSKLGSRINVTPHGIYYNCNTTSYSTDPQYELVTKKDLTEAITGNITNIVTYKGSVDTYDNLPTENMKVGDMYDVKDSDNNYVWNGENWDSTTKNIDFEVATEELINDLFK